jgi:hypothetical protein
MSFKVSSHSRLWEKSSHMPDKHELNRKLLGMDPLLDECNAGAEGQ